MGIFITLAVFTECFFNEKKKKKSTVKSKQWESQP